MSEYRWVPVGDFRLGPQEREAILAVFDSGQMSEGPEVACFEKEFAAYVGTKYCIAVNSGTSALIAMLKAMQSLDGRETRSGSKVITSPLTYIATAAAVDAVGYEPVFVDVDPTRFCIQPESVAAALDAAEDVGAFAAILPVHLMGYPADLDALGEIARQHAMPLLEDSAQAHGTTYQGQRTGSIGLAAAFSFYIAHNIQAGEMGAVTTDDEQLARVVHSLKAHGRRCACRICRRREGLCPFADHADGDPRFTHDRLGYNFKPMEFQAVLGRCQLPKADAIFAARQHNVRVLNELLAPLADRLVLPAFEENVSYLAYPLVVRETCAQDREELCRKLEALGVENRPLFSCLPTQQPAFAHLREQYVDRLPNAEHLGRTAFYIGCHQFLTDEDLDHVAKAFHAVLDGVSFGR